MEVHINPELKKKLIDLTAASGMSADQVVEDALAGYFDDLGATRAMLDRRYDDLESGRVEAIDGEEAYQRLMARTATERLDRRPD